MMWWAWMVLGAVLLAVELFAVDAQFYLVFGIFGALVWHTAHSPLCWMRGSVSQACGFRHAGTREPRCPFYSNPPACSIGWSAGPLVQCSAAPGRRYCGSGPPHQEGR